MLLEPGSRRRDAGTDVELLAAMVEVEVAWVRVQHTLGLVDAQAVAALDGVFMHGARVVPVDLDSIVLAGESGGNPVLPLIGQLRAELRRSSPAAAAALHRGLTSQDVLDSALMLVARRTLATLVGALRRSADATAVLARTHRDTLQVARTLGQPALPTTFGCKAAGWLAALDDASVELAAVAATLPVQCGGAAGTLAAIDLQLPGRALEAADLLSSELGLASLGRPWHTDRSVVTRLGDGLARAADVMGKVAGDVLLLGRPEIGELREAGGEGRGASSALPQKQNPVLSVLIRATAIEAPHLAATLHSAAALAIDERPDGAWHAEWSPLSTLLRRVTVASLQTAEVLAGLEVHPDAMLRNVEAVGPALVAERLLAVLPALTPPASPTSREQSSRERAPQSSEHSLAGRLREALRSGADTREVRELLRAGLVTHDADRSAVAARIDDLLDPAAYLGAAGEIIERALARHASLAQSDPGPGGST